ncbi:MAG: NADH-quinone oxidoreductase subunit NuoN [Candidatus Nanopelagicales bacterium]|nr:NADH-quinone oxidoreductase subunit NuoN [Candidatus Nanopelagicales bacterium]
MSAVVHLAVPMAETLTFPSLQYRAMAPILIVLGAAVLGVVVEALVPQAARRAVQLAVTLGGLATALVFVVATPGSELGVVAGGTLAIDGPGLFLQMTILVVAIAAMLVVAERRVDPAGDAFAPRASSLVGSGEEQEQTRRGWSQTEVWPLSLFAVGGMLLFVTANDLLILFLALEVMSLPLYLLAGMARRRRLLSQEAAMKYFLLGSFASAFLLYGSAMLFGYAGSLDFAAIADAFRDKPGQLGLQVIGLTLLGAGLLFKAAAVPFHMWAPDVYQGAPTPITGFMAGAVKVAAFGALLRVMYVALGGAAWEWQPAFWVIASVTMLVGVVLAVTSSDIKRMLAYSSVAHAGFLLLGVVAFSTAGLSATMFYLLAYGLTTVGAFAVVMLVRGPSGEAGHLSSWAGLGRTSPVLAGVFALFLLALAGIPLTSGFTAKFGVFAAAIEAGGVWPVIAAVVASAISAFFYLKVIVLMFFARPGPDAPAVVVPSLLTTTAIGVAVVATLLLGVFPQAFLDLASGSTPFLR